MTSIEPGGPELRYKRVFEAPRDLVFAAWSNRST